MKAATARARPTVAELARRPWLLLHGSGRSTTRRLLLWLMTGLLILSVEVFGSGLLVFVRVHDTADAVRNRTVPAIFGITTAKSALLKADSAAVTSFTRGGVHLSGPGEEFQNQFAVASQSLTVVAEHNMAGAAGSSTLQLVDGLMVTYAGLIGQADAHFRQPGGETLGAVDLWSASRLLHRPGSGILTQLELLLNAQKAALDGQLAGTATAPGEALVLLLPVVAFLALLVITSLVFRRRFRRKVNLWLVLAAVLLVSLTWISARAIVSHQHLETTRDVLYQVVANERARGAKTDAQGQKELASLMERTCADSGGCGDTLARFLSEVKPVDGTGAVVDDARLAVETRNVAEQAAIASADAGLRPMIYLLAALLGGAVLLGFRPRLNEYRYRSR